MSIAIDRAHARPCLFPLVVVGSLLLGPWHAAARADGTANSVSIRRLKDKMGTIGVPTGELILNQAAAHLIGEAADGFRYMAEMLNHTRYWNAVGSVGMSGAWAIPSIV